MTELIGFIPTLGVWTTLLVFAAYGLFKLLTAMAPNVVKEIQLRRADQAEHEQDLEFSQIKVDQIIALAAAGSRSFNEEQLTKFLDEIFIEFQEGNTFVRDQVHSELKNMNLILQQILEILAQERNDGSRE